MQKFIHLSLTVAILLAAMGFRVNESHCAKEKDVASGLFSKPACCCHKEAETSRKSCADLTCITQQGTYQVIQNSSTQQAAKFLKVPTTYPGFSTSIRPAILEAIPHFTFPPPTSGRFIGILLQTFII